jgi:signal transduction histidine kinase
VDVAMMDALADGAAIVPLSEAKTIGEANYGLAVTFGFAVVVIFLVLAAQFESVWSAVIVMATVPFGLACAVFAMLVTGGLLHALTLALEQIERQNALISAQNERKTRLLASVSHDISTPLTSMNVIAQLIRGSADRPSGGADVARLAAMLEANARSLAELFSDLLDSSSIDSGTVPLRETVFPVDELLREECRVLEPLAQGKNLRLAVEAPAELRVRGDRIKLARVVRNLLSNALKFTEAGSVTARCSRSHGAVEIRIEDTGPGIALGDRERIFLEFTQLNGARPDERAGWGLGLAICRRLVALMGGTLEVESEPGHGSTFIVRLPGGASVP